MVTETKLNARQLAFCRYYADTGNASDSYRSAGYSSNGAEQSAHNLLRNTYVRAEVAKLREQLEIEATVDKAYVITKLRENVDRSMQAVEVTDHDGNGTGEYQYQGSVANRSLELLGKTLRMFVDVTEASQSQAQQPALKSYTLDELVALRAVFEGQANEQPREQVAIEDVVVEEDE